MKKRPQSEPGEFSQRTLSRKQHLGGPRNDGRRRGPRLPSASLPPYGCPDAMRQAQARAQQNLAKHLAQIKSRAPRRAVARPPSVPIVLRKLPLAAAVRAPSPRRPARQLRRAAPPTRQQAAIVALLLLPAVVLAAVLSLIPGGRNDVPPLQSRPNGMAALERQLPRLAMPISPPQVVPPPGDIRFAILDLPVRAPVVPGVIKHGPIAMPQAAPIVPGEIRVGELLLPRSAPDVPPQPGNIIVSALQLPRAPPEFLPPPPPAKSETTAAIAIAIAPPPPAAELCVAATGKDNRPLMSLSAAPGHTIAMDQALPFGERLAAAAVAQTREMVVYNAKYVRIAYPMGDVAPLFGVCSDVIVRAYRALGIDLQELVARTRSGTGDTNIDHRRTDVLRRFFATHGHRLTPSEFAEDYLPGDVVTYYRPQNKTSTAHIGLVTNVLAPSGRPMIVHNRGWGPQLEDALFVDQMTGHYRFEGLKPEAIAKLAPRRPQATPTALAVKPNLGTATDVAPSAANEHLPGLPKPVLAGAVARICRTISPATTALRAGQLLQAQCKPRPASTTVQPPAKAWKSADRMVPVSAAD